MPKSTYQHQSMPAAHLRVWALSSRLTHCIPWLFARPPLYLTQNRRNMLWRALFRNKTIVCLQLCIISLRAPRASLSAFINPASTHNAPTADCKACLLASSIYLGKTSLVPRPSTPRPFGKLERENFFLSNFLKGRGAEGLGTRLGQDSSRSRYHSRYG